MNVPVPVLPVAVPVVPIVWHPSPSPQRTDGQATPVPAPVFCQATPVPGVFCHVGPSAPVSWPVCVNYSPLDVDGTTKTGAGSRRRGSRKTQEQ